MTKTNANKQKTGQVYIFDFGDKIKVGFSTNVEKRLRTIELSSGIKAKQIYTVNADRKTEKIVHSWLENRLEGEFFAFSFDDAKRILDDVVSGKITDFKKIRRKREKGKFDKINYNNSFNAKKYDRINLMVSKGKKDEIKEHAEACGESTNAFINRAIDETIERDKEK